jgi:preprotein translocase subunit SecA
MPDRRWGDGLHKQLKRKRNYRFVKKTVAAITYQNFFLLYPKLSGMTGTGKTAEVEFEKIYNLSVEEIPTARPNQRKDLSDLIYKINSQMERNCKCNVSSTGPYFDRTTTVENQKCLLNC